MSAITSGVRLWRLTPARTFVNLLYMYCGCDGALASLAAMLACIVSIFSAARV